MMSTCNVLYLTLKSKWYDMIESGVKTEEYREIKDYWNKRLNKSFDIVCFSYGYTKRRMFFKIKNIDVGYGNVLWGAPENEKVYIIKLGERIDDRS